MRKHLFYIVPVIMAAVMLVGCGGGGGGSNPSGVDVAEGNCSVSGKITLADVTSERAAANPKWLADAKVYLEELPGFSTMTKSDGSYHLNGFPKGNYHIVAKYESKGKIFKMRTEPLEIKTDKNVDDISVIEATNKMTGCIKDETGNYLPKGTKLVLWGEEFYVGDAGEFITPPLPELGLEKALNNITLITNNKTFVLPVEFTSDINAARLSCVVSNVSGAVTGLKVGPNLDLTKYYGVWDIVKEVDANNEEIENPLTNSYISISAYGINAANCVISKSYSIPMPGDLMTMGDITIYQPYAATFTCCLEGDIWRVNRFYTPEEYWTTASYVVDFIIEVVPGCLTLIDADKHKTVVKASGDEMTITGSNGVVRHLKKRAK